GDQGNPPEPAAPAEHDSGHRSGRSDPAAGSRVLHRCGECCRPAGTHRRKGPRPVRYRPWTVHPVAGAGRTGRLTKRSVAMTTSQDPHAFLDWYRRWFPDDFLAIEDDVSSDEEITGLLYELAARNQSPLVLCH